MYPGCVPIESASSSRKTCATFPKIRRTYPCVPTVIQDVAADDLEPSWPVAMQILTRGESNRSVRYSRLGGDLGRESQG